MEQTESNSQVHATTCRDGLNHASPNDSDAISDTTALLAFAHRHAPRCPRCGYDLRAIREPICPECGDVLRLAIRSDSIRLRWFLLCLPPGFFSGICAAILTLLMIRKPGAPGQVYPVVWVGYASGVSALAICFLRRRFLRLPGLFQAGFASAIWIAHLIAFYFLIWIYI